MEDTVRPPLPELEQAALTCVYLAIMSLDPTGKGRKGWTTRRQAALNTFAITFDGRLTPTTRRSSQGRNTPLTD